jgi:hypothetical protein
VLVAIVFSSDLRKVCVICLLKFYPKCIVAVICVICAESVLPCCCPKCLLEVVNICCAEVPSCVRGWWLMLFLIVWKCECEKVITDVANEDACLCFGAWTVCKNVIDE